MKFSYTNLRSGEPASPTLAELLIDVEADLVIWDGTRQVLSEPSFPVGELAYHLGAWINDTAHPAFVLDTMSTDPGWVTIKETEDGWIVGSVLEPDVWLTPVPRPELEAEVRLLVRNVRADLQAMGIDSSFFPGSE